MEIQDNTKSDFGVPKNIYTNSLQLFQFPENVAPTFLVWMRLGQDTWVPVVWGIYLVSGEGNVSHVWYLEVPDSGGFEGWADTVI